MRLPPLRLVLLVSALLAIAGVGHAAAPKIEPLGDGTYRVTVSARHKFTRNTDKLQAEATRAAEEFCSQQGKHLNVVSVDDRKSMYLVGDMAKVTLIFKAIEVADREQVSAARDGAAPSAVGTPATNEALYNDLLRLDDLRKRGILTDDEFAVEKKKLLDRKQ